MERTGREIVLHYTVQNGDILAAGKASCELKRILQQIGIQSDIIRRITVSSYEAEMNVALHSHGGQMTVSISPARTEIAVEDEGPGIDDVDLALQAGFSTAPEAVRRQGFGGGMGLPNIIRCSDQFDIHSVKGEGTTIRITVEHF